MKHFDKYIKIATMTAVALALTACTHGSPKNDAGYQTAMNGNGADAASAGATSFGVKNGAGYQATGGFTTAQGSTVAANGMQVNSLKAPTNQAYYFDYDSNGVHASDYPAINAQAAYLAAHSQAKIRLEGNTDDRGSREYNVALGYRRDQAVSQYLEQRGVSAKQIQMVSYGKEHPAVAGDTQKAWSLNRRVNLIYKG